jgi:hypothetical protein
MWAYMSSGFEIILIIRRTLKLFKGRNYTKKR